MQLSQQFFNINELSFLSRRHVMADVNRICCHITETVAEHNGLSPQHQEAHQSFMYIDESTQISASGLRYLVKENGAPFQAIGAPGETRSCIKCGKHKARSKGSIKRVLNALMFFCFDCRPLKKVQ